MSQLFGGSVSVSPAWLIQENERIKYDGIFESLGPISGKLPGDKVRPVMLNSKLPVEVLGKVWELSDIDKDGLLDKEEFCVAMHLVYRAIEKDPVPSVLPTNLIPPSKRSPPVSTVSSSTSLDRVLPGAVSVLPPMPASPSTLHRHNSTSSTHHAPSPKHATSSPWVAGAADRARFTAIFQQNKGPDNFINGATARNVFVQSGLAQNILAHVWNMCDQQQCGRLSSDQFVLAMHLISQKVKGIDLPNQITPEMLSASSHDSGFGDVGSLSDASSGVGDTAAMRELDALNQEIEELRKEKKTLQGEIQQKELSIRNTSHEVQELQDTLDRDSSSLAQLECDKAEAHTRLDELEQQRNKLDTMLGDVRLKVQDETETIKSLRAQLSAQEASVSQQETELRRVRSELAELQKEEVQLEQRLEAERQQQSTVEKSVKETQAEIIKVQEQLKALQDQRKSVSSNIEQYDKAVAAFKSESNDDFAFNLQNTSSSGNLPISDSVFSMGGMQEKADEIRKDLREDPFADTSDPFQQSDPFAKSDPFGGSDPFASNISASAPSSDPFASNTSAPSSDPFAGTDPFSSTDPSSNTNDPFKASHAAFAFSSDSFTKTDSKESGDPFAGQDPFAGSGFDSSKSASGFTSDPFPGTDAFSSETSKNTFDTNTSKTTGNTSSITTAVFDAGAFAKALSDTESSKENTNLFEAFPETKQVKTSSHDPWGSAFGGTTADASSTDPFGGDAFASDTFAKSDFDPFATFSDGVSTDKEKSSSGLTTKPSYKPSNNDAYHNKPKHKVLSEADQLTWAKEESKRAEEDRLRKKRQEEADLELAIALSKQQN